MVKVRGVEQAERAARARATVMAIAALVLVINAVIEIGSPDYSGFSLRSAVWIFLIAIWLLILAVGGGLTRDRLTKALMNDELSLQNRARALAFGFYAAILVALVAYAAAWFRPLGAHDALRLVTGLGISAALARYSWLEFR
jgi:hypothetical protein